MGSCNDIVSHTLFMLWPAGTNANVTNSPKCDSRLFTIAPIVSSELFALLQQCSRAQVRTHPFILAIDSSYSLLTSTLHDFELPCSTSTFIHASDSGQGLVCSPDSPCSPAIETSESASRSLPRSVVNRVVITYGASIGFRRRRSSVFFCEPSDQSICRP